MPRPNSHDKKNVDLDFILDEYLSKLEQKFVAQTYQLQTITDNAASCLFLLDQKCHATYLNPSAQKVTGY